MYVFNDLSRVLSCPLPYKSQVKNNNITLPVVVHTGRIFLLRAIATVRFKIALDWLINAVSTIAPECIAASTAAGWKGLSAVLKTDIIQSYITKTTAWVVFGHKNHLQREMEKFVKSSQLFHEKIPFYTGSRDGTYNSTRRENFILIRYVST